MTAESEPDLPQPEPGVLLIEWNGSFSRAFQRCLDLLGVMGADLVDADPNHGFLAGSCGPSLGGIGYNVRIDFETHMQQTSLRIQSTPKLRLLDWGAAEGFLKRFKATWARMPDADE